MHIYSEDGGKGEKRSMRRKVYAHTRRQRRKREGREKENEENGFIAHTDEKNGKS